VSATSQPDPGQSEASSNQLSCSCAAEGIRLACKWSVATACRCDGHGLPFPTDPARRIQIGVAHAHRAAHEIAPEMTRIGADGRASVAWHGCEGRPGPGDAFELVLAASLELEA
jgi:hypothetical protein